MIEHDLITTGFFNDKYNYDWRNNLWDDETTFVKLKTNKNNNQTKIYFGVVVLNNSQTKNHFIKIKKHNINIPPDKEFLITIRVFYEQFINEYQFLYE